MTYETNCETTLVEAEKTIAGRAAKTEAPKGGPANGHATAKLCCQIDGLSAEAASQVEGILLAWASELDTWAPEPSEEYKNPRWDMVRELKGIREMASLEGYHAIPILVRILDARALDLTILGYETEQEAINDLESLWDKVRLALGEAPLNAAVRLAKAHPVKFKIKRLNTNYHLFLAIAYHLQKMRGDEYICLPVIQLSRILGVTSRRVSDYREFAQEDGLLVKIADASWNPAGPGVATKFRFLGKPATPAAN